MLAALTDENEHVRKAAAEGLGDEELTKRWNELDTKKQLGAAPTQHLSVADGQPAVELRNFVCQSCF